MTNQDLLKLAKKRAGAKLGFYIHATVFVIVNVFQVGINSFTKPEWSILPTLGWGLGLTIHYLFVFVLADWNIKEWLVEDELAKLEERQPITREK